MKLKNEKIKQIEHVLNYIFNVILKDNKWVMKNNMFSPINHSVQVSNDSDALIILIKSPSSDCFTKIFDPKKLKVLNDFHITANPYDQSLQLKIETEETLDIFIDILNTLYLERDGGKESCIAKQKIESSTPNNIQIEAKKIAKIIGISTDKIIVKTSNSGNALSFYILDGNIAPTTIKDKIQEITQKNNTLICTQGLYKKEKAISVLIGGLALTAFIKAISELPNLTENIKPSVTNISIFPKESKIEQLETEPLLKKGKCCDIL